MSVNLFVGLPGMGKSAAMQIIARDWVDAGWLVLAVDRAKEWGADAVDTEGHHRWGGDPPRISELPQEVTEPDELVRRLCKLRDDDRGWLVRFDFPHDGYSLGVLARRVGQCAVFDDEADYTSSRHQWDEIHAPNAKGRCVCGVDWPCELNGFSINAYRDFVHRGRHLPSPDDYVPRPVHLFGAMRKPQNVHTDLTAEASQVMLFQSGGASTFERIRNEGWLDDEQLLDLEHLPKLHYYLFKRGEGPAVRGKLELP